MWFDRILCLANSYKHDHRCVAGMSLITKKWIRLVGRQVPGCLTRRETSYPDGTEVALLDVFEAEFDEKCGTSFHPEDIYVNRNRWRRIRRFDEPSDARRLLGFISNDQSVLQGYDDSVSASSVMESPLERSLELIHPEDLWWWIREDRGKRRNRAIFRVNPSSRVRYDLAVTDPATLDVLNLLPASIYPHAFLFGGKPPKTLLTISLSEPFDGFLYKLVAGVIHLPV
jgi:hypothetical protein